MKRRPLVEKAPASETWLQAAPSDEDQTVVVEPVVPSIIRSLPTGVKYGPKSKWKGGLGALRQLTW